MLPGLLHLLRHIFHKVCPRCHRSIPPFVFLLQPAPQLRQLFPQLGRLQQFCPVAKGQNPAERTGFIREKAFKAQQTGPAAA